MAYLDTNELLAAALTQLGREYGGAKEVPIELADASNSPVMWEPEVFDDTYVNPNGIRNDGTRGSTIEQHTDESRNNALFKSLPKDPASRVIWDMVPAEYHYLKQFEKPPREIRFPEDERQDEVSNTFFNQLFELAKGKSVFSNDAFDKKQQIQKYLDNDKKLIEFFNKTGRWKARNPVGDSVPIKPYKTNKGVEYLPYPYGPLQNFPKA